MRLEAFNMCNWQRVLHVFQFLADFYLHEFDVCFHDLSVSPRISVGVVMPLGRCNRPKVS